MKGMVAMWRNYNVKDLAKRYHILISMQNKVSYMCAPTRLRHCKLQSWQYSSHYCTHTKFTNVGQ